MAITHIKTLQQFIIDANIVHNNTYDYSLVEYKNNKTKIKIICKIHGVFEQTPGHHTRGSGCCLCTNPHRIPLTTEQFIIKANIKHNNKFDYSLCDYKNDLHKIKIICPLHGLFEQSPSSHLRGVGGCKICTSSIMRSLKLETTENFIENSLKVHNNTYDYSLSTYIDCKTKVKIICKEHGIFEQLPLSHINGCGCPICKLSKGEAKVKNWLILNNIEYVPQKKFDGCKGKRNVLPFDFYLPKYNICIEYDGKQHFEEVNFFGGNKVFKRTKEYDIIKTKFCQDNDIFLFRIKYSDNINYKLDELFKNIG